MFIYHFVPSAAQLRAKIVLFVSLSSAQEVRERRYTNMRRAAATRKGRDDTTSAAKAFVRLRTSAGALNLRLDCDLAPRTCHNFLTLCERGYYNGTKFHRCV